MALASQFGETMFRPGSVLAQTEKWAGALKRDLSLHDLVRHHLVLFGIMMNQTTTPDGK